jgi:hypothetical protein
VVTGRPTALAALVLGIVAAATGGVASGQDVVGVYLTYPADPTTGMVVNWVNLYPQNTGTVWFRETGTDEWASAEAEHSQLAPSALQLRRVELGGLRPDRPYEFGIGSRPEGRDKGWRFRTMPARLERLVRFVSGGDMMHSREQLDRMNRQAARLEPDFALLGGDFAYANGVAAMRWVDWLGSWSSAALARDRRLIPIVPAIGNHEVRGGYGGEIPKDAPYYYGLFVRPGGRSYHALDVGDYLSLVVLDSGHTEAIAGPQASWLAEALAAREARPYLFVAYHFPAYGTAKGPADGLAVDHPRSAEIREHWLPHLDRFGPTAVFEHDHHTFKRTHRLRGHRRDDENGLIFLGDGAWGVKTRPVPAAESAWWLAKAEARNHLWAIDLRPSAPPLARAFDEDGEIFDEVELVPVRPMPVPEGLPVAVPESEPELEPATAS